MNVPDGDTRLNFGDDGENMVSSSKGMAVQGYAFEASSLKPNREKHLRFRTRVFAAEYVILRFSLMFSCYILFSIINPWSLVNVFKTQ